MFFKKELKNHIQRENNIDPRSMAGKKNMQHVITDNTHQALSID
jgi:hypothetical protein